MIVITDDILKETMVDLLKETYANTYEFDETSPNEKEFRKKVRKGIRVLFQYYLTDWEYKDWKKEVKSLKKEIKNRGGIYDQ